MQSRRAGSTFCLEQPWLVFNATQQYSIATSANASVSHFYSFVVDRDVSSALVIPDGCVDIIFDCDENNPSARICGSPLKVRGFDLHQAHRYFGVRFSAGHVPRFSNLSASELNNQEVDLAEVVGSAAELFEFFIGKQQFVDRCACFESYLERHVPRQPANLTNKLIALIKRYRGSLSMNELEKRFFCSGRTMQRTFKEDTGMSPKAFSRIVRCQAALALLEHETPSTALDIALTLGFSDQSHFQREFKELVNITPLDFVRKTHDARYRESMQRFR